MHERNTNVPLIIPRDHLVPTNLNSPTAVILAFGELQPVSRNGRPILINDWINLIAILRLDYVLIIEQSIFRI